MSNPDEKPKRYYRKIIKIRGEDSPNVRVALAQQRAGLRPTGEVLTPGVLTWDDYCKRMLLWDPIRICIGIHAEFYEGHEVLLYPPTWLDLSARRHEELYGLIRHAEGIGIDPGEGGGETAMAAVDRYGLIELVAKKTPNTAVITSEALAFMIRHQCSPAQVCFDAGGGGKQHADRLREDGHTGIRLVEFGSTVTPGPRRGIVPNSRRVREREERYQYTNRRAEMYGKLRTLLDPVREFREEQDTAEMQRFSKMQEARRVAAGINGDVFTGVSSSAGMIFAIPSEYTELRRQLAPIPLTYDKEGRLFVLPKNNPKNKDDPRTLTKLLGCSPDQADALVLAIHAMSVIPQKVQIGAIPVDPNRRYVSQRKW